MAWDCCRPANFAVATTALFAARAATDSTVESRDCVLAKQTGPKLLQRIAAHGQKMEGGKVQLSPMLTVDPKSEQFVGDHADLANQFLKRQYRAPYVVPEIVS